MAPRWQLADRTLELERPIGVGIVNVTDDSFYEGARSGTPERAVQDGLALVEAGFEMLDVGAVACLDRPRLQHRELPLRIAEEGAPPAEQRAVEIGVDAAERHGREP